MKAVFYCATRSVYDLLLPSTNSIIKNTSIDKIYWCIEDDQFPYIYPSNKVQCINVSKYKSLFQNNNNNKKRWGGYMNLIRFLAPTLFSQLDEILYLDYDTIIIDDIAELFAINIDNYYIAGVRDREMHNKNKIYISSGTILFNLKKMREDHIQNALMNNYNKINTNDYPCQTILAATIPQDKIYVLSSIYNSCIDFMNYQPCNRKIIHYPWSRRNFLNMPMVKDYLYNSININAAIYMGTRNVYQNMIPAMKSLIHNSNVEKIFFLIEDDVWPSNLPELPEQVQCVNLNTFGYFNPKTCPNSKPYWGGVITCYRVAYAKMFPNFDKMLSLDNDTIVKQNISELWDLNLDNYYIAGAKDIPEYNKNKLYINAGVVMHNLKKMRKDNKVNMAINILNTQKKTFPEQDVFNELYQGHILELPGSYNSAAVFKNNYNPDTEKIIHYVGDRKYPTYPLVQYYKNLDLSKKGDV